LLCILYILLVISNVPLNYIMKTVGSFLNALSVDVQSEA